MKITLWAVLRFWCLCGAAVGLMAGGAALYAGNRVQAPAKTLPGKTTPSVVSEGEGVEALRMPLEQKVKSLIIPNLVIEEKTARKFFDELRRLAKDADPEKNGINLIFRCSPKALDTMITLNVSNISVLDLLRSVCRACHLKCEFEAFAIIITDAKVQ